MGVIRCRAPCEREYNLPACQPALVLRLIVSKRQYAHLHQAASLRPAVRLGSPHEQTANAMPAAALCVRSNG